MSDSSDVRPPVHPGVSPRRGFALVLESACSQFETLRSLIRGEVRCVSVVGNPFPREASSINMALAQSFLFFSARAYKICEHGPDRLELPREVRKSFLRSLAPIVGVRDVNEHGFDLHSQSRGRTSKPSMHIHEEHSAALDETSLIILGESNILMGPLNLADVYVVVDGMRNVAGFRSLPAEDTGMPPTDAP